MRRGRWNADIRHDHLKDLTQGSDPQMTVSSTRGRKENYQDVSESEAHGEHNLLKPSSLQASEQLLWSSLRWVFTPPQTLQCPCHQEDLEINLFPKCLNCRSAQEQTQVETLCTHILF